MASPSTSLDPAEMFRLSPAAPIGSDFWARDSPAFCESPVCSPLVCDSHLSSPVPLPSTPTPRQGAQIRYIEMRKHRLSASSVSSVQSDSDTVTSEDDTDHIPFHQLVLTPPKMIIGTILESSNDGFVKPAAEKNNSSIRGAPSHLPTPNPTPTTTFTNININHNNNNYNVSPSIPIPIPTTTFTTTEPKKVQFFKSSHSAFHSAHQGTTPTTTTTTTNASSIMSTAITSTTGSS
eukprot:c11911_g1_i1.p1 GENE.c11911_g1_i1~~c11911_g1_i1.p1  ORF type:complete len:235 (+),score=50.97 c11911_g1_i1:164-868(+)